MLWRKFRPQKTAGQSLVRWRLDLESLWLCSWNPGELREVRRTGGVWGKGLGGELGRDRGEAQHWQHVTHAGRSPGQCEGSVERREAVCDILRNGNILVSDLTLD